MNTEKQYSSIKLDKEDAEVETLGSFFSQLLFRRYEDHIKLLHTELTVDVMHVDVFH